MLEISLSVTALAAGMCLVSIQLIRHLLARLSLTFLLAYLAFDAVGFVTEWLMMHPHTPHKALWLSLYMASSLFVAPCLWLFTLETSANSRPSLRSLGVVDWGVLGVGLVLILPLGLATHSGTLMVDPDREGQSLLEPIIHETMLMVIGIFLLQVIWYLRRCLKVVGQHRARDFDFFSNIDDMPLATLRALIWLLIGNWLLSLLRTARALGVKGPSFLDAVFVCAGAVITIWAVYVILKRCLLSAGDKGLVQQDPGLAKISGESEADDKVKYAKSAVDATVRQRIQKKLHLALTEDKIFTQSNLKLRDLCDHLHENAHYVSQVINEDFKMTFYELLNQHRINAAKEQLLLHKNKGVLDIALDVGFNSKPSFNAAFKRLTGRTPTDYRRSAEANRQIEKQMKQIR